jgi:aldose 1-epimerase
MQMQTRVQKSSFGTLPDGTAVDLYTLANANGLVAKVATYGAIITELHVPDRQGKLRDIVLGFDNLGQYLKGHPYFGATVGRVANRIAKGRFTLDGKTYALATKNGPNHLHGGLKGFDKVIWKAEPQPGAAVRFAYTSPDGEEGYPGTLEVAVTITLTDANELRLDYRAITNKPTPVNLTNHSYFNLAGHGDVLRHELMIAADHYTPSDSALIPTGEIRPVGGTPMDFTRPEVVGARFAQLHTVPVGYDHNYVLNSGGKGLALAARVYEPETGRVMEVHTTEPGVQLYTANFLDGSLTGKGGVVYLQHTGLCLETQHFPDSVNQPAFPSTIVRPGQTYSQTTVYKFSVQ